MKTLVNVLAAVALAVPFSAGPTSAGQKILPPAFGKELVPEQSSQEYKGPSAEIEERIEEEKEERAAERPRHQRGGGGGGRVRIQLDGDVDGGGREVDDDF
ncbi:MAG: hypothetical protein IT293_04630 [Deltaproteobacteria bacterium]|nr:hypothetical protein [Deltaproteobacteria bacterium]